MKISKKITDEEDFKKFFETLQEIYFESFKSYGSYLEQVIKSDTSAGEKISADSMKRVDLATKKNIQDYKGLTPEDFVKKWEKKFRQEGEKSRKKLLKLVAL